MPPWVLRPLLVCAAAGAALAVAPATASTPGAAQVLALRAFQPPLHPETRAPFDAPRYVSPGERVARLALEAVGVPYRWGGESPESGFDCSGLVRWAHGRLGIDVPHSSYALHAEGEKVSWRRRQPGDVLVFSGIGHVGLYLGDGLMVHAPHSGKLVEVVELDETNYGQRLVGIRRFARL